MLPAGYRMADWACMRSYWAEVGLANAADTAEERDLSWSCGHAPRTKDVRCHAEAAAMVHDGGMASRSESAVRLME